MLPLLQVGFSAGPEQLGVVLGVFLAGVGIFQIPAGFAALRWGGRVTSLAGLTLMGAAGLASAFSPTLWVLASLRFLAGVGAAFFFGPGLSLVSRYFPPGQRGPVIGLYNGAFSVGGAAGLFVGALVGELFGWPIALGIGGIFMLGATAIVARAVPREVPPPVGESFRQLWLRGKPVLRSRSIWALALALTGFWGAVYVVTQYLVQFAFVVHPAWGTGAAAALAAGVVLISFPAGPVGGWIGERASDRRVTIAIFGALTGAIVFLVPVAPLIVLVPALLALGFCDGVVFAVQYLMPAYFAETRGEELALGIGLINSAQVLVGSGLAVAFGYLITAQGWTVAWLFAGIVALGTLPLLVAVERQPRSPHPAHVAPVLPPSPGPPA